MACQTLSKVNDWLTDWLTAGFAWIQGWRISQQASHFNPFLWTQQIFPSQSVKKIWKTCKFWMGLLCSIHWKVCECVMFVSFLRQWNNKSCTGDTAGQRHSVNCTGKYVWFICMINTTSKQCTDTYIVNESSCHLLESVKIVNMQGVPSKELASELEFDFPIETLGTNLT